MFKCKFTRKQNLSEERLISQRLILFYFLENTFLSTIICVPNFVGSNHQKVITDIWLIRFFFVLYWIVPFLKFRPIPSEKPRCVPGASNKSYKKYTNLLLTNEEWSEISEEKMKYFLEEYGKISSIKTLKNRLSRRNDALVCYRTTEDSMTTLAELYQNFNRWTAVLYKNTSKYEKVRVNEGLREVQNNSIERGQQREREYKYQWR